MKNKKNGIAFAGNIITDTVKNIDTYPSVGMLATISAVSRAVGGCAPNTAIDVAVIDPSIPVSVYGCVGDDDNGVFMIEQMRSHGIDTSGITGLPGVPTSFSDVMSLPSGERTFFHARGANALFDPSHIPALSCRILHIGYVLLLDRFDAPDDAFGTVMARFLHDVQARGVRTSVDVVSQSNPDYPAIMRPALPYTDYLIFNELECCGIWGLEPYEGGKPNQTVIRDAMERTMCAGVKEKVIVHCKQAGFALDKSGKFTVLPSLCVPKERIKGSVGAGDAFCAACLYAIYHEYPDEEILDFASRAAAVSLSAEDSVSGMKSRDEILRLTADLPKQTPFG